MKNPFEEIVFNDLDDKPLDINELLRMTKKEAEYHAWNLMKKALKEENEDQMNRVQWIIKMINE